MILLFMNKTNITTMKTINIYLGLLLIFSLFSLNVSADCSEGKKDKKDLASIAVTNDLTETETYFESWMIELKEFNSNAIIFPDEEIQIETWMTIDFSSAAENNFFIDQDINLEDWMSNMADFNNGEISFDIESEIEPWMCEIM